MARNSRERLIRDESELPFLRFTPVLGQIRAGESNESADPDLTVANGVVGLYEAQL
jgi:hypothetical protein